MSTVFSVPLKNIIQKEVSSQIFLVFEHYSSLLYYSTFIIVFSMVMVCCPQVYGTTHACYDAQASYSGSAVYSHFHIGHPLDQWPRLRGNQREHAYPHV